MRSGQKGMATTSTAIRGVSIKRGVTSKNAKYVCYSF